MAVSPWMAEDLSSTVAALYQDAELRLLGIIARQLAAGLESPGWAVEKLGAVQSMRQAAQDVVGVLAASTTTEVHHVIAEAYNRGHQAGLLELGALDDDARRRAAEILPNTQTVDRIAAETTQLVTATHRGILRGVEDGYRQVIAEVAATPALGIGTRRQATQHAMQRFADRGLQSFVDRAGRSWSMTTYAEMAVRTSVGRAAVDAHNERLTAAGIDLVMVSNSPQECPKCKPWEGKVLALTGPDGKRSITVEHATEDGRQVTVHIAGTVDEARRAGLQHPNCKHRLVAYLPGVTRVPQDPATDPDGYAASQRQREIERNIRKYKARAEAAVDPAGRAQAQAAVRRWQGAMRGHLDEHPELMRKRYREQPGASNLPTDRPVDADAIEAARVRAGNDRTVREMGDDQLAAAARSGVLDGQDLRRVEVEADRRDTDQLLARVQPGGRTAQDLTAFGDDELARALPHLDDEGVLRVAAELDRRDLDAALPGARADLIGLSERQLAERARHADGSELALLAAEADRRQLLAQVLPGGRLTADLTAVSDDVLGWAVRYARAEDALRIAAELDRRYPVELPAARTGGTVADQVANRAALDELLAPAGDVDDWAHLRDLPDVDPLAGLSATERWIAEREAAEQANRAAYSREKVREMYAEHLYLQWLDAEEYCRGYLLSKRAELDGVDPRSLFSGPSHVAYARASEELKRYWSEVSPRVTLAEYSEQLTGVRSAAADTARNAASDQARKF